MCTKKGSKTIKPPEKKLTSWKNLNPPRCEIKEDGTNNLQTVNEEQNSCDGRLK